MTADSKMKAKIVRVKVEEDKTGIFVATSPDLKGFLVAVSSTEELDKAIPAAISDLYEACGVNVVVTAAEDSDEGYTPWVAVPTDLARAALSTVS